MFCLCFARSIEAVGVYAAGAANRDIIFASGARPAPLSGWILELSAALDTRLHPHCESNLTVTPSFTTRISPGTTSLPLT